MTDVRKVASIYDGMLRMTEELDGMWREICFGNGLRKCWHEYEAGVGDDRRGLNIRLRAAQHLDTNNNAVPKLHHMLLLV